MKIKSYCTQNKGICDTCALVQYGRDCKNIPLTGAKKERMMIRLSGELKDFAEARARRRGITLPEYVRALIAQDMKKE
jgi:predicted HicB family RNase H-like nuclease